MIKKIISLLLFFSLMISVLLLSSCTDEKSDVLSEKPIKVAGVWYSFADEEVENSVYGDRTILVVDKWGNRLTEQEDMLAQIYKNMTICFESEDELVIMDLTGFFDEEVKKGVREGNVLKIEMTNPTGDYTYDLRVEIHKDKVVLIHDAHFYQTKGTYLTVTFKKMF